MVGTATALLIGAGIKAGVDIYRSKRAGDAAKDAAEIQSDSGREAIGVFRDMQAQGRADLAPWRDTGGQAMTSLGSMMGLPSGPVGGAPPPAQDGMSGGGLTPGEAPRWPGDTGEGSLFKQIHTRTTDKLGDWLSELKSRGEDPQQAARAQTESSLTAPTGKARMRAPTGEEDDVPEELVSSFEAEGFQRV